MRGRHRQVDDDVDIVAREQRLDAARRDAVLRSRCLRRLTADIGAGDK